MKNVKLLRLISLALFLCTDLVARDQDTTSISTWEHNASFNFYFFQDPFVFLPVYEADKGHLHLGARYNYEDLKTFSAWVGYNFMGGDRVVYVITPMVGGVVGQTNCFAAGAEIQLDIGKFSFYSESEYLFDVVAYDNDYFSNYFYTWTDISYSVTDWLSAGLSVQKTRIYREDNTIERGFFIGTSAPLLDVTGYFYSPFTTEPYFILTLSKDF